MQSRFGGIFTVTLGLVLTIWMWHMALTSGEFYPKMAFLGPAIVPSGLFLAVTGNGAAINRSPVVKFGLGLAGAALGGVNLFIMMA